MGRKTSGQPPTDIAQRGKVACFQSSVKGLTGLGDDALDELFCKSEKGNRKRTFYKMGRYGRDPESPAALKLRKYSLVEVIAKADGPVSIAADLFRTPLWRLVTPPPPTTQEIHQIIQTLLTTHDLYRALPEDISIGNTYARDKTPFGWSLDEDYKHSISSLAEIGHIDHLALMGALYKEAISHGSLDQAQFLQEEFDTCLMRCAWIYQLSKDAQLMIEWLCNLRLFGNRWDYVITEEMRAWARETINRKRVDQGLRPLKLEGPIIWVDALTLRLSNQHKEHLHPIVPHSPETRWVVKNRAHLLRKIKKENEKLSIYDMLARKWKR